jgi:hypothetical protein
MFSAKDVDAPLTHDKYNGTGNPNASGTLSSGSSTATAATPDPETTSKPELDTTALSVHRVDGGFEAWSVIAGASVALFVQFGLGRSSILLCTVGHAKSPLWCCRK